VFEARLNLRNVETVSSHWPFLMLTVNIVEMLFIFYYFLQPTFIQNKKEKCQSELPTMKTVDKESSQIRRTPVQQTKCISKLNLTLTCKGASYMGSALCVFNYIYLMVLVLICIQKHVESTRQHEDFLNKRKESKRKHVSRVNK